MIEDRNHPNYLSDNNLYNPYSKATCVILYIQSMELGAPPVYKILNETIRNKSLSYMESLGPYAFALKHVTEWAEIGRIL